MKIKIFFGDDLFIDDIYAMGGLDQWYMILLLTH